MRRSPAIHPLSPRVTLGAILRAAPAPGVFGVWVEGEPSRPASSLPLSVCSRAGTIALVLGADLAALARRTTRILVRRGRDIVCLDAARLPVHRHLEIVEPDGRRSRHALAAASPESVLGGHLARCGGVAASRVGYSVDAPRSPPLG